jgi:hypothetical protein
MMDNIVINDNNDNEKNNIKTFVKLKNLKYKDERIDILKKIYNIIGINDNNKTFYSHELDSDIEKQKEIELLDNDIKKYFKTSTWLCYNKNRSVDRKYISIIKYVLKDMLVDFTSMSCKMKIKNITINTTQYIINSID